MAQQRRFPKVQPSPERGEPTAQAAPAKQGDPLGKLLLEAGAISKAQLEQALTTQRKTFLPLGRILRDEHGLLEAALAAALRKQHHFPRIFLRFFPVVRETMAILDKEFCREHQAIAFELLGSLLCVAMNDPRKVEVIKRAQQSAHYHIQTFSAPWEDIRKKLGISE